MNIRFRTPNAVHAAYVFAFAVIVAVTGLVLAQPATAQRNGPYYLVAHSNQNANVGVFRINQGSGQVSFCYVEGSSSANVGVRCTAEVE